MKKKILLLMLAAAITSVSAAGCNSSSTAPVQNTPEKPDTPVYAAEESTIPENDDSSEDNAVSNTNDDNSMQSSVNEESSAKDRYDSVMNIIENAVLQYPTSNDEFEYNVYDTYIQITKYIGKDTDIVFPGEIDGLPVLVVGDLSDNGKWVIDEYNSTMTEYETLNQYSELRAVYDKYYTLTFSEGISVIGESAFYYKNYDRIDSPVKSISLPKSLVSVGKHAFFSLRSLTSLTLPEGLYSVGIAAFQDAFKVPKESEKTVELVLPKSLAFVGDLAFSCGLAQISDITIPNPDMQIGEYALPSRITEEFGKTTIHGYAKSTAAQYAAEHTEDCIFKVMTEQDEL